MPVAGHRLGDARQNENSLVIAEKLDRVYSLLNSFCPDIFPQVVDGTLAICEEGLVIELYVDLTPPDVINLSDSG